MGLNFGKIDFSTSFDRTSAFPLDAKSYFEKLSDATTAAQSAEEAGSTTTCYYFGQTVAVVENNVADLYIITPQKTLRKLGEGDSSLTNFYVGYYHNGEFYKDSTYQTQLPHKQDNAMYLDLTGSRFYKYIDDNTKYQKQEVQDLPIAKKDSGVAGITKLYGDGGTEDDGAMTQKAVTEGVRSIRFSVDSTESECLILDLPWKPNP